MNCKRFLVLIAAAATLPLAAQIPDDVGFVPTLTLSGAGAPAGSNASVEAALRQALLGQVATEEEVEKALSFMPDVVADVNGTKITKKQIIDMLISRKISQQVLALTSESYLRTAMQQYVEQKIDTEILRQKAKEAGFVPSEELVKTHFDEAMTKLPSEQVEELKLQLKERGFSLDSYRDEIAKEDDIQANASIAA